MKLKNILAEKEKRIRDWRIVSALLMVVVMYQGFALKTTVNDLTVHIPPRLERGATLAAGEVPKPNVYSFSYYLFQTLSTWEKDGSLEAPAIYNQYRQFLTDNFKKQLLQIHEIRTRAGETKGRSRTVREVIQKGYDSSKVVKITDTKWVVKLDMLIVEKIGDAEIKRVAVRYPVIVILDDTDPENNPWGFKFAGFDSEPKKILIKGEI
jgi:integrating conjugative element protein (TIGR03746 family)